MTRRQKYFLKQKLLGALMLALLIAVSIELKGDVTGLIFIGPLCIYTIFTKEMVVTDSYYFDVKEGKIQEDEES